MFKTNQNKFKNIFRRIVKKILQAILLIATPTINGTVIIFSHLSKYIIFKGFAKTYLIAGILFSTILVIFILSYGYYIWNTEIDVSKLKHYQPITTSRIFDVNNNIITEIGSEKRIFVSIDKIPQNLIYAFMSAEDRTFYTNPGVDIMGFIRAAIMDVKYFLSGKKLHGASTITQQVVRNVLLSNERTLTRKIKEIILSLKITKMMTKNELMEVYLNQIYLGSKSYGVEAASKEYFDKSVQDLAVEECALLASLTKAPSTLDPRKGKAATLERRNWVLDGMFKEGYLKQDEFTTAIQKPISLSEKKIVKKPYAFIDYVIQEMMTRYNISKDDIDTQGYDIYTSFNPAIYESLYKSFNKGIIDYDRRHGYIGAIDTCNDNPSKCLSNIEKSDYLGNYKYAIVTNVDNDHATIEMEKNSSGKIQLSNSLWAKKRLDGNEVGKDIKSMHDILKVGNIIVVENVEGKYLLAQIPDINGGGAVIDPKTGNISAMIGGYLDMPGIFNRAFQAKRQPGSVAKTFAYFTALENGFKPSDIIIDSDVNIATGGGTVWNPKNDGNAHHGAITLRRAFEKSLNTPIVRIIYELGPSKLTKNIRLLGVANNIENIVSNALGTFESSVVDILQGYSIIINGGLKISHHSILSYKMRDNKVNQERITNIEDNIEDIVDDLNEIKEGDQIINAEVAYQTTSLLLSSAIRGTAAKFGRISTNLVGKTGTTNDAFDVWFIGGSSEHLIGIYIGYDTPRTLGSREYGGVTSLPVAIDVMSDILKFSPAQPFKIPEGIRLLKVNQDGKISPNGQVEVFKSRDKVEEEESQSSSDLSGTY